jgi:hypothetical protein
VDRYALTLTPAIAYFIVLAIYMIYKHIDNSKYEFSKSKFSFKIFNISKTSKLFKKSKLSKMILPISLIIILIIFTTFGFSNNPTTFDNQKHDDILYASTNEKIMANFLINHDDNYSAKVIWADRGGDFSFFLRMNIPSVDGISNQTNFTEIMLDSNVSYFIANGKKDNIKEDYLIINNIGNVYLYERII